MVFVFLDLSAVSLISLTWLEVMIHSFLDNREPLNLTHWRDVWWIPLMGSNAEFWSNSWDVICHRIEIGQYTPQSTFLGRNCQQHLQILQLGGVSCYWTFTSCLSCSNVGRAPEPQAVMSHGPIQAPSYHLLAPGTTYRPLN